MAIPAEAADCETMLTVLAIARFDLLPLELDVPEYGRLNGLSVSAFVCWRLLRSRNARDSSDRCQARRYRKNANAVINSAIVVIMMPGAGTGCGCAANGLRAI